MLYVLKAFSLGSIFGWGKMEVCKETAQKKEFAGTLLPCLFARVQNMANRKLNQFVKNLQGFQAALGEVLIFKPRQFSNYSAVMEFVFKKNTFYSV